MKRLLVAGASAIALFAGSTAMAQDGTMAPDGTITIAPAQQTVIKEYVVKEKVKPVTIDEDVSVGTTIPQTVELAPVPEQIYIKAPEVRKYRYFYWNNRVVFVDPDSRKVVDIVD